jgi:hypothetical protein
LGGSQFKANLGKKLVKPLSQQTSQAWYYISTNPSCAGGIVKRMTVQTGPRQKKLET